VLGVVRLSVGVNKFRAVTRACAQATQ
jgi:hypothetical protein